MTKFSTYICVRIFLHLLCFVTHSETLSNRIGIMVAGQLRAIGTPQHLHEKYVSGYDIIVKSNSRMSRKIAKYELNVVRFISNFKSVRVKYERYFNHVVIRIIDFCAQYIPLWCYEKKFEGLFTLKSPSLCLL